MLKSKGLKFAAVIAASVLTMTACSKKPTANGDSDYSGSGASQTYGANDGKYQTDAEGFRINALTAPSNQTYYFAFDSSEMRSEDMKALMIQANYMAAHPSATIRLEGNTDNRGSREYNIGLGWRRDQTVARVLEQQGVRPNQI